MPADEPARYVGPVEADERRAWHREVAVAQFNTTWNLIDKTGRTVDDDMAMVLAAATSRWHWAQVGGPEQVATGDWQVAHVACLLGLGDLAALFAARNLATAEVEGWDGWRLASAHEGMARACAVQGKAESRSLHVAAAHVALEREPDPEERAVIEEQLATLPSP
jgi:hypothetical protein